jgi:hypothetical protein
VRYQELLLAKFQGQQRQAHRQQRQISAQAAQIAGLRARLAKLERGR